MMVKRVLPVCLLLLLLHHLFLLTLALISKGQDLLACCVGLLEVLLEVAEGLLEVVDLLIVGQLLVVIKPTDHVVMGVLENSIVVDKLEKLVWLDLLRYPFLGMNEELESLELL
jgi:hypothetical protein